MTSHHLGDLPWAIFFTSSHWYESTEYGRCSMLRQEEGESVLQQPGYHGFLIGCTARPLLLLRMSPPGVVLSVLTGLQSLLLNRES